MATYGAFSFVGGTAGWATAPGLNRSDGPHEGSLIGDLPGGISHRFNPVAVGPLAAPPTK